MFWTRKVIPLQTGSLRFKRGETVWDADLIVLKLVAERLERKHKLEIAEDGRFIGTPEFLTDLASELTDLGCPDCTPSIAAQIWISVAARFVEFNRKVKRFL